MYAIRHMITKDATEDVAKNGYSHLILTYNSNTERAKQSRRLWKKSMESHSFSGQRRPCPARNHKFNLEFFDCVQIKNKGSIGVQNYYTRTGPTPTPPAPPPPPKKRKKLDGRSLPAPAFLNHKRWWLYYIATPLYSSKNYECDSNFTFLHVYLAMLNLQC